MRIDHIIEHIHTHKRLSMMRKEANQSTKMMIKILFKINIRQETTLNSKHKISNQIKNDINSECGSTNTVSSFFWHEIESL